MVNAATAVGAAGRQPCRGGSRGLYFVTVSRAYVTIALTAAAAVAVAQSSVTHPIGLAQGLPDRTVYDIHFDAGGWMLVATPAGLFRYDGDAFTRYGSPLARDPEAHAIQAAPDGSLYVANFSNQVFRITEDSLALVVDLGPRMRRHTTYAPVADGIATLGEDCLAVYPYDTAGVGTATVGMATVGTAAARDYGATQHAGLLHGGSPSVALVTSRDAQPLATLSAAGLTWLGERGGGRVQTVFAKAQRAGADTVHVIRDLSGDAFAIQGLSAAGLLGADTLASPAPGHRTRAVVSDPEGRLIVGGTRGVFRLGEGGTWVTLLAPADVSALQYDGTGGLWAATLDQGVVALAGEGPGFTDYAELGSEITSLVRDGGGSLYGATRTGEVYRLGAEAQYLMAAEGGSILWRDGGRARLGDEYLLDAARGAVHVPGLGSGTIHNVKAATRLGPHAAAYATRGGALIAGEVPAGFPARARGPGVAQLRPGRARDLSSDAAAGLLWVAFADSVLVYSRDRTRALGGTWASPLPTLVRALGSGRALLGTRFRGVLLATVAPDADTVAVRRLDGATGDNVTQLLVHGDTVWVGSETGLSLRLRRGGTPV